MFSLCRILRDVYKNILNEDYIYIYIAIQTAHNFHKIKLNKSSTFEVVVEVKPDVCNPKVLVCMFNKLDHIVWRRHKPVYGQYTINQPLNKSSKYRTQPLQSRRTLLLITIYFKTNINGICIMFTMRSKEKGVKEVERVGKILKPYVVRVNSVSRQKNPVLHV